MEVDQWKFQMWRYQRQRWQCPHKKENVWNKTNEAGGTHDWLAIYVNILVCKIFSMLDQQRIMRFANANLITNLYSIICFTKTCLTDDISCLFTQSNNLSKHIDQVKKVSPKNGEIFIAVAESPPSREILSRFPGLRHFPSLAKDFLPNMLYLQILPPKKQQRQMASVLSFCQQRSTEFKTLLTVGDINFKQTDCTQMILINPFEHLFLDETSAWILEQYIKDE